TISHHLGNSRTLAPAIPGSNQPIEGSDQQIFPLIPDGGKSPLKGGTSLGYRHFGMGAGSKCLPHHGPPLEFSSSPEIAVTGFHIAGDPDTVSCDPHEVDNDDNNID